MTWQDIDSGAPTTPPAPTPPDPATTSFRRPDGLRRTVLTAGIAGALLVTGGVAAVFAASPEPSGSAAPSATTDRSSGGGTGSIRDSQGHDGQPCPDDGGGSGDSGSDGGQPTQPSPSTATPAT